MLKKVLLFVFNLSFKLVDVKVRHFHITGLSSFRESLNLSIFHFCTE